MTTWDFEGYWNTVLGAYLNARDVITTFDLDATDRRGLDEWLGEAEEAAIVAGRVDRESTLEAWVPFHAKALEMLSPTDWEAVWNKWRGP